MLEDLVRQPEIIKKPEVRSSEAFALNPGQLKANMLLGGPQMHTCLVGGSRSGKTTLLVRRIVKRAIVAPGSRHLIARFRANAVRASVLVDTFPKVMRKAFPKVEWQRKQEGYVEIHINDDVEPAQLWFSGLDDEERIEKILGMEFATIFANECSQIPYTSILVLRTRLAQMVRQLNGAMLPLKGYYDLNPTTKAHWTNLEFGQKVSPLNGAKLPDPEEYERAFVNPTDNAEHLDPKYIAFLRNAPEATRRRFFEGMYVDAIEGALWTSDQLELARIDKIVPDQSGRKLEEFVRIGVGVDPSGAQSKFSLKSDEIGIVVAGKRRDGTAVVLEDVTFLGGPNEWATKAVAMYKKWKADFIVAEANYGGGMVESTIKAVDRSAKVRLVTATRGKVVRAEPVSALYDEKKVFHAGRLGPLEEELCLFAREGYLGERSPNRADACIWVLTELMLGKSGTYTLQYIS